MDIIFNLSLVAIILILFFLLRYSENVYLYVGIIMFSVTGLVITVSSPLYIEVGVNESYVYENTTLVNIEKTPIKQDLEMYNYIFQLFYLMTMIGSIIYWSISNPRYNDD